MNRHPSLAAVLALTLVAGCGGGSSPTGPDGDVGGEHLVVFATDRGRAAGDLAIALYDLDAGGFRALPGLDDVGAETEPCLSNDGYFVAFSAVRASGATGRDLYVYDRLNKGLLPTPNLNSTRDEDWPRFTHDSSKLAFVRVQPGGERRVRLYEPLGDTLLPLTGLEGPAGTNDDMPAPDLAGTRLAFVSDRAGTPDVLVWDRAAGLLARTGLASPTADLEPSLSANGRWLAFASDRAGGAGGFDVYLADLVADSLVALPGLNSGGDDRHPAVSADGSRIVFQSDRTGGGGQSDLYLWSRATGVVTQPSGFRNAAQDVQPYLRWR